MIMEEQVKKKVAFLWDAMWAVLLLAEHLMAQMYVRTGMEKITIVVAKLTLGVVTRT